MNEPEPLLMQVRTNPAGKQRVYVEHWPETTDFTADILAGNGDVIVQRGDRVYLTVENGEATYLLEENPYAVYGTTRRGHRLYGRIDGPVLPVPIPAQSVPSDTYQYDYD